MGFLSGEELYRRFLNGDKSSFDEIINMYHDGLIYFLYGMLKNYDEAEEAAEDAFAELVIHKRRYSFRSSLKSYLYAIGKHKAADILRRKAKLDSNGIIDEDTPSDIPGPEESVINDELKREVRNALDLIHKDYREALHLVYFDNMGVSEAARALGKTKKQTENCLYRGKLALKAVFAEAGKNITTFKDFNE